MLEMKLWSVCPRKMKTTSDFFGKIDIFQVGDLVFWSFMGEKRDSREDRKVGIVSEVFFKAIGGRNVSFAKVFCLKDKKNYEIPTIILKKIDKNETIYRSEDQNNGIFSD